ncbi:hypothetical protein E3N88_17493 [Mikania micrantha]|uniref:DYW domain-containing protein n=1 Tax=Mikania micrantha TaxID=192012 RepID=A0A5N6NV27_9ASTR|nr:hypothetical protein E3N88_17469 [Mikania micrantha]KAD5317547.1 hypothetical protein E3N88_17493 [Mikania micrantha]
MHADDNGSLILRKCIALLHSCATSIYKLQQIHAFSIRHGVPHSNPDIGKHLLFTLVSLAAPMSYAHKIFRQINNPNIFTWNTMIRGYAESENPKPAMDIHRNMRLFAVEPDTHTYPFLLKAIAKLIAVREGEEVHSVVIRNGFGSLVFVQNGLVHMYAACGRAESAHKLFDEMSERNLVTWNSVINGFVLNGRPNETLVLYRDMVEEGMEPDGFTLVSLLTACAELGASALGKRVHSYMFKVGLAENLHAANALLDLYAKTGNIIEAQKVFSEMKENSVVSWTTLIVGLAMNGFGVEAINLFKEMERKQLTPSEITFVGVLYALRNTMLQQGIQKSPGHSLVELGNRVYQFTMGDNSHPQSEDIYLKLMEITKLLRLEGYVPHIANVLADIEEEEKETALSFHSEKIAIAFMLINTPSRAPITVVKNLRIKLETLSHIQVSWVLASSNSLRCTAFVEIN